MFFCILDLLLQVLLIVLLVHVVFSWIPRPPDPILPLVRGIDRLLAPILEPIRRVLPPLQMGGMGLDLSVLVVFFAIYILMFLIPC
ncbi:MAG: YggT family protein [Actinobacteria bacterium]|nr:YggT family protein [Actinomycetota bacterium]